MLIFGILYARTNLSKQILRFSRPESSIVPFIYSIEALWEAVS